LSCNAQGDTLANSAGDNRHKIAQSIRTCTTIETYKHKLQSSFFLLGSFFFSVTLSCFFVSSFFSQTCKHVEQKMLVSNDLLDDTKKKGKGTLRKNDQQLEIEK
jgi:hypothetical protein